jgi:hypothetical protein
MRTEWNRAARIDAADRRVRLWRAVTLCLVVVFALPGVYNLLWLSLEIGLPVVSLSIRTLPLYREGEGLFLFWTLPLGWFGTPLALAVIAAGWRRLDERGRWMAATVVALAAAGVWFSSLYFPFRWVFDRWSVH